MKMEQSVMDPCLYYRRFENGGFLRLALYVDDSLQACPTKL